MDFRSAVLADVPAIMTLQAEVMAGLSHSDMFSADDTAFYQGILAGQGHVALARVDGQIVGCSVLRYPSTDAADNLAADVGLPCALWAQAAHLEAAFLLPLYRGRGLGHRLSRHNMDIAVQAGRPYILATAWPCNAPSLKNLCSLGFRVRALAYKYGGKLRCILLYRADVPQSIDGENAEVLRVALDDVQGHKTALANGLQGSSLCRTGNTFAMIYTHIST